MTDHLTPTTTSKHRIVVGVRADERGNPIGFARCSCNRWKVDGQDAAQILAQARAHFTNAKDTQDEYSES